MTAALLAVVGIVAVGGYVVHRPRRGLLSAWIPAFLVGGATSNLLDRLAAGAVHGFLATPWVVFNLADLAVAAGCDRVDRPDPDPTRTPRLVRHDTG